MPSLPAASERWALFLDIDGTLVELANHPSLVRIDAQTKGLLERIRELLCGALAVLSGRCLADVDQLLAPLVLPAGALHGLQWRDALGRQVVTAPPRTIAAGVRSACQAGITGFPGVWLEEKAGIGFALHYRAALAYGPAVQSLAQQVAVASLGHYVVQLGVCVAELKPGGSDKGSALRDLLETPAFQGRRPVVIGDDLTDESAFAYAQQASGLAVLVGARRPTHARYALANPSAVLEWLGMWAQELQHRSTP